MAGRAAAPTGRDDTTNRFGGTRVAAMLAVAFIALIVVRGLAEIGAADPVGPAASAAAVAPGEGPAATASAEASLKVDGYLEFFVRPAPALELTGPDGGPISLAGLRGVPVLVFFGYTHCPDVCPTTIGAVGETIDAYGGNAQAIFVSVDPERDTVPWLSEFVRYMPAGFTAATGTPAEIRSTADAWGVRYARVEEADPDAYSMSHTADVFVVDAAGQFRARLPFGTDVPTMTEVLRRVVATTVSPTPAPNPTATPTASAGATAAPGGRPATALRPTIISTSVWAGGQSPVIFDLHAGGIRLDDPALAVTTRLSGADGSPVGASIAAVAVRPPGIAEVSWVATLDIPTPGPWRVAVTAVASTGEVWAGPLDVIALDPGGTAALGEPAPTIRTPTAGDFGGDLTWVTTDALPDARLSRLSTVDALAAAKPFVLIVDSYRFKVTDVCGTAIVLGKRLQDRWVTTPFIHHEPYRFTVITSEPVLEGTLQDPRLTVPAEAWGVGAAPWGVGSMPWIFVVDGDGIVRAKYQGVVGTTDVDVLLSLFAQGG